MKLNEGLIKALAAGEIAVEHTGTRAELRYIISAAFPNDVEIGDKTSRFYFRHRTFNNQWDVAEVTDLPSFSVDYFFEGEFVNEKQPDIPEFVRGELVEVREYNVEKWVDRIYLTTIEGAIKPYMCVAKSHEYLFKTNDPFDITHWTQIRKLQPKHIEVTRDEIATWKGCKPEQIVIV